MFGIILVRVYFFSPMFWIRHPRSSPFKTLRVLLVFEEPVELWAQLLSLMGAASVRQYQSDKDSSGMLPCYN